MSAAICVRETTATTLAVIGFATLLSGCELPEIPEFNDDAPSIEEPEEFTLDGDPDDGEHIYQNRCATCHGEDGQGDGPTAVGMNPPPTDFTEFEPAPYRAYLVTREGGREAGLSAGMPAFRRALDETQLHDVVAYTLAFAEDEPVEQQQPDSEESTQPAEDEQPEADQQQETPDEETPSEESQNQQ